MPTIIGKDGVVCRVPVALSDDEMAQLHGSADALKAIIDQVDFEA